MKELKNVYHRDGTVTYWSVSKQVWIKRAGYVCMADMNAMSQKEQSRLVKHFSFAMKLVNGNYLMGIEGEPSVVTDETEVLEALFIRSLEKLHKKHIDNWSLFQFKKRKR